MKRDLRKRSLRFQRRIREFLKKPMRRRLRKLYAKRNRLLAKGQNTAEVDREISYWEGRRANESVYGAANAWLTPISDILKAQRLSKIKKQKKET